MDETPYSGTEVDVVYEKGTHLRKFISSNDPSSLVDYEDIFRKHLIVSAASYFEKEILGILETWCCQVCHNDEMIVTLVRKKALERQYFRYFDWNIPAEKAVKNFFKFFGPRFADSAGAELTPPSELSEACKDFCQISHLRDTMVHNNYAAYSIELDSEQIYTKYKSAIRLIHYLRERFLPSGVEE